MAPGGIFRRAAWHGLGVAGASALAVWLLAHVALLRGLEDWMHDGCFFYRDIIHRGPRTTQTRVVLIPTMSAIRVWEPPRRCRYRAG
jgi:hypothetical protein